MSIFNPLARERDCNCMSMAEQGRKEWHCPRHRNVTLSERADAHYQQFLRDIRSPLAKARRKQGRAA